MSNLKNIDYVKILEFYKEPIPDSSSLVKSRAENILASKLCRCIKKFDKTNESRAIGICTKTVLNNKGYKRGKFTCKNKPTIKISKTKIVKNKSRKK
jgi:hypothetical protein